MVGIFGGRLEAVPLLRHHVQQHRPLDLPDHGQILLQLADVVAVDRADVAEAQFLEEHAAHQAGLDRVFDLREEPLHRVADHRHAVEHLLHFGLQAGVEVCSCAARSSDSARPPTRGQIDILLSLSTTIRFFFSPPAWFMASKTMPEGKAPSPMTATTWRSSSGRSSSSPHLSPRRRGHAAAGVAGHEQVVVAFGRVGIAHQAALGPHRVELVVAAGDHLVG